MLKFVLILAAGYGLIVTIVYFMQGRMLYLPNVPGRTLTMTPTDAGMDYEDVSIETADGGVDPVWWTPDPLRRRSPQCQNQDHRMRRSSGNR